MQRDLDLIRKIVLAVESLPTGTVVDEIAIAGYTEEQIGYHSYLIVDSGLAEGVDVGTLADKSPNWRILHLTSAGHDFADAARNDTTWNKATGIVKEKVGTATIEIVKEVLVGVIKSAIGFPAS